MCVWYVVCLRGLREVVGAVGHELDHGGELVGDEAGAGQLQHRAHLRSTGRQTGNRQTSNFEDCTLGAINLMPYGDSALVSHLVVDGLAELLHVVSRRVLDQRRHHLKLLLHAHLQPSTHMTQVSIPCRP